MVSVFVDTSGASEITARQDKLTVQGVDASHKLAEHDLVRMNKYKKLITRVGQKHGLDPAIIAGIISRESRAGAVLDHGWGDHGNGFGLMQVDKRYHKIVGTWDSEEHISQGSEILNEFIRRIQAKFPAWPKEHQLKGAVLLTHLFTL
uniref:Lysozyme g n=2 Tax=Oncorhynchus TaxID=8016 RepID=A0A8C8I7D2_ONCTS